MNRAATSCILTVLFAAVGSQAALPNAELSTANYSRIVVIPDVHGDSLALLRSLWLALGLIDKGASDLIAFKEFETRFAGAVDDSRARFTPLSRSVSVALVQLGDLVDRGPHSIACLEIMEQIQRVIGWRVLTLYGNHEISNMAGDSRLVHPGEAEKFGGMEPRMRMFAPNQIMHAELSANMLGMVRLSGGNATNGADQARNPATLFVHGGINMGWLVDNHPSSDIGSINALFADIVSTAESLPRLQEPTSPLWTRDLANADEAILCRYYIDPILAHFKVARIVVGHTPQEDRMVKNRCNGKIILTDVMMSRWMETPDVNEATRMGGRPVAVIMTMGADGLLDSITAHHTDLRTGVREEKHQIFPVPVRLAPLPNAELNARDYTHIVVLPDTHGDLPAMVMSIHLAYRKIQNDMSVIPYERFYQLFEDAIYEGDLSTLPPHGGRRVALVQLGNAVDFGPAGAACSQAVAVAETLLGWTSLGLYGPHEVNGAQSSEVSRFMHPLERAIVEDVSRDPIPPSDSLLGIARVYAPFFHDDDRLNPNTLFVHGGIDLEWLVAQMDILDINDLNSMLRDSVREGKVIATPLPWLSALAAGGDDRAVCDGVIQPVLSHFSVARIVVSHVATEEVSTRCDGRVILTNVGMSRWVMAGGEVNETTTMRGGKPVAVIIEIDRAGLLRTINAHYTDLRTGRADEMSTLFAATHHPVDDDDDDKENDDSGVIEYPYQIWEKEYAGEGI